MGTGVTKVTDPSIPRQWMMDMTGREEEARFAPSQPSVISISRPYGLHARWSRGAWIA
jgi:hypothetical protein